MEKIKQLAKHRYKKHKKLIKYLIIGASGAGLDLIVFTLFVNIFLWNPFIVKSFSTTLGITNNFILNIMFNFKVRDEILKRFLYFFSTGIFGLLLSLGIFWIFITNLGWDKNIVNLITIVVVILVQYNLNKHISFGEKK
ncbi:MAG: GtrA family protein [bacterium]